MQPSQKFMDLHWLCNNIDMDPKSKLNLAAFYKTDKTSSLDNDENRSRSCVPSPSTLLQFETNGPYIYNMYMPLEEDPRCLALDLFFKEPVTVSKIRFQNYYVASVSLLAKMVGLRDWISLEDHKELMESPHYENGARKYFELQPLNKSWTEITEIRFILRQPSSIWKKFYIENIWVNREESETDKKCDYLTKLIQRTEEALRMESLNEKRCNSLNTNIPFNIGTRGYEIEKLPKF